MRPTLTRCGRLWEGRTAVAGVGGYSEFGLFSLHGGAGITARPYTVEWVRELGARILGLTTVFVAVNEDPLTKVDEPFIPIRDVVINDARVKDLTATDGDPLTGARTVAFIKSAKYFLDMMTITTVHPDLAGESNSDMFRFSDFFADDGTEPFDDDGPFEAGSWAAWFAACVAGAVSTPDLLAKYMVGGTWVGYSGSNDAYMRCDVDLYYRNQSALAHNLLMQFNADVSDAGDEGASSWQYKRAWDWLGLAGTPGDGWGPGTAAAQGDIVSIAVAQGLELVPVGRSVGGTITPLSEPVEPFEYTDFMPFDGPGDAPILTRRTTATYSITGDTQISPSTTASQMALNSAS